MHFQTLQRKPPRPASSSVHGQTSYTPLLTLLSTPQYTINAHNDINGGITGTRATPAITATMQMTSVTFCFCYLATANNGKNNATWSSAQILQTSGCLVNTIPLTAEPSPNFRHHRNLPPLRHARHDSHDSHEGNTDDDSNDRNNAGTPVMTTMQTPALTSSHPTFAYSKSTIWQ